MEGFAKQLSESDLEEYKKQVIRSRSDAFLWGWFLGAIEAKTGTLESRRECG
jgi:hypothetical protein